MKYVSANDIAAIWNITGQQVRIYCRTGRIPGAKLENGAWYVPDNSVKPTRKDRSEPKKEALLPLAKELARQMTKKSFHGLYDYVQINLAYSSGRLASVRLTRTQAAEIYSKNKVKVGFEPLKVSDLVETTNHFQTADFLFNRINEPLSEKMVKEIHLRLTQGTVDERKQRVMPGEYRTILAKHEWREQLSSAEIARRLKQLIAEYEEVLEG